MNRLLLAGMVVGAALGGCRRAHSSTTASATRAEWVVHIKDFRFQPAQLTVRVGDAITWVNDDSFRHSAVADDMSWGSSELERGRRFPWVPETPGRYAYHCSAHPTMRATLTVEARPPQ